MRQQIAGLIFGTALLINVQAQEQLQNPVVKKMIDNITFYLNFDEGTSDTFIGNTKSSGKFQISDNGFFGKALSGGELAFPPGDVIDTTKPGTAICWISLEKDIEKTAFEPGFTFFVAQFSSRKRFLCMKQTIRWGEGCLVIHSEFPSKNEPGKNKVFSRAIRASVVDWKAGQWKMIAITWTPELFGISVDGAPFSEVAIDETPGSLVKGSMIWIAPKLPRTNKTYGYLLDECMIFDKKLSSDELKDIFQTCIKKHEELKK